MVALFPVSLRAADPAGIDAKETARRIIARTNVIREREKLLPVKPNAQLTKTAEYFAQYMASKGVYGHTADGKQPVDRAIEHGYDRCILSENIAHATNGKQPDEMAALFVDLWEKSPMHLVNILDPDVTEIGAAVAQSATTGQVYAVQMFGRPKSAIRSFTVVNETLGKIKYKVTDQPFEIDSGERIIHYYCRPPVVEFAPAEKPAGVEDPKPAALTYKPRDGVTVAMRQYRDGSWQLIER
jgi:hypothetical protein